VELGGGATLKVHKSDVTTPYSRCVPGEQLRLEVATAVALLRAGFTTRIEIGDQVSNGTPRKTGKTAPHP